MSISLISSKPNLWLYCLLDNSSLKMHLWRINQPRPQGFSLKKWVGREKALASAGHVSPRTP